MVFSDRLAAISVFIRPLPSNRAPEWHERQQRGQYIPAHGSRSPDHRTGRSPQAALVRIADGVEVRKR